MGGSVWALDDHQARAALQSMRFGVDHEQLGHEVLGVRGILSQYLLEVGQGVRLGLRRGLGLGSGWGQLGASPWRLAERRGPSSSWPSSSWAFLL